MDIKNRTQKIWLLFLVIGAFVFTIALWLNGSFLIKNRLPDVRGVGAINWYNGAKSFQLPIEKLKELYPALSRPVVVPEEPWTIKSLPLHIENKNGKYYWASNENKPLKLEIHTIWIPPIKTTGWFQSVDVLPKIDKKTGYQEATFYVFVASDGDGFIVVRKIPAGTYKPGPHMGCGYGGPYNYTEYRVSDKGTLTPYMGATKPFPYPEPHNCSYK